MCGNSRDNKHNPITSLNICQGKETALKAMLATPTIEKTTNLISHFCQKVFSCMGMTQAKLIFQCCIAIVQLKFSYEKE